MKSRATLGVIVWLFFAGTVASMHAAEEPAAPRFLLAWGKKGSAPGEFHSPIGIAVNAKDEVLVTDLNNARVQIFTSEGAFLRQFDLPRDNPVRKSSMAGGIAVDAQGLIYLGYMEQNKIQVYRDTGELVREWGKKGTSDGDINGAGGLLITPEGTVIVADQRNHRVQTFTQDGKFLSRWGEHGAGPGQFGAPERAGSRFAGPHFVARDREGRLYTTEGVSGRVQQFSPEGKPLLAWGSKGDEPGGFGAYQFSNVPFTFGPVVVTVDPQNRVWVSSLNDRVQAFTPEGKFLFALTDGGFDKPHGMAFDSKGHMYVADAGNQRIVKYELPK